MNKRFGAFLVAALILGLFVPVLKLSEFVLLSPALRPDVLMAISVSVGWMGEPWATAPLGFGIGLVEDVLVGRALGTRAASLAVCACLASLSRKVVNPDLAVSRCLAAMIVSVCGDLLSYGLYSMLGFSIKSSFLFNRILTATAVWSLVLALPIYPLLAKAWDVFHRRLELGQEPRKVSL